VDDDEELLKEATDIYYKANSDEEEKFYKSLSGDQLKRVKKHIHRISLFESIDRCREKKRDFEDTETNICTFYDSVLELLEIGEHIDNDILIDLLKYIGKHRFEDKKMEQNQSTNMTESTADDEVDILTKAIYGWPTKL
jgi:hypothetical protein